MNKMLKNYKPELEKLATQYRAIINFIMFNMQQLAQKEMFNLINESFRACIFL